MALASSPIPVLTGFTVDFIALPNPEGWSFKAGVNASHAISSCYPLWAEHLCSLSSRSHIAGFNVCRDRALASPLNEAVPAHLHLSRLLQAVVIMKPLDDQMLHLNIEDRRRGNTVALVTTPPEESELNTVGAASKSSISNPTMPADSSLIRIYR